MTRIRVSIVTFNNADTIERCLESVLAQSGDFEVAISVVDNNSGDDTAINVRAVHPDVELIEPGENLGFGAGHNRVLRDCSEPFALLLNPDAWLLDGALDRLLDTLNKFGEVALAGPRMEYADGRPQLSFGRFPGLLADIRQRSLTRSIQAGEPEAVRHLDHFLNSPIRPNWIDTSILETISERTGSPRV